LEAVASGLSPLALAPASTRQDETSVAPFQLANKRGMRPAADTASAGNVVGCASHGKR
jgi:hypothetical protein